MLNGELLVLIYVLRGVMFSCLVFRALKDADKAIMFAPQNPKGYYRRGEALRGLKVNLSLICAASCSVVCFRAVSVGTHDRELGLQTVTKIALRV
jgi:hypothetical protein